MDEGVLSNRCLIFLEGQIYFMCRKNLWREDLVGGLPTTNFSGSPFLGRPDENWNSSPQPILEELIGYYSPRILTFPSDIVYAFWGIENAIGPAIGGTQFFFGLTSCAFDASVLWAKKSRNEVLTRRPGAPSWSWMGWEGATSYLGTSYFTDEIYWLTTRTRVDWYIVDSSYNLICVWDFTRDTIIDNQSSEGDLNLQDKLQPIWRYGHSSKDNPFGRKTVLWPVQENLLP
ncbi:hypothetical protein F4815DRAFT_438220 [Daldinia loculata]|nr:hypothetical protein F4815DRAFT_438220 [Daldinia loculata]